MTAMRRVRNVRGGMAVFLCASEKSFQNVSRETFGNRFQFVSSDQNLLKALEVLVINETAPVLRLFLRCGGGFIDYGFSQLSEAKQRTTRYAGAY